LSSAPQRRRWFLEHMRARPGRGSDLAALMRRPRRKHAVDLSAIGVPFVIVGGVATAEYMPERSTQDIDVLVSAGDVDLVRENLQAAGAEQGEPLAIAGGLGLCGETWRSEGELLDVLWSDEPWAAEALAGAAPGAVIALPYLVLMKLDAARGVDQGDLTRMLGFAPDDRVESVRRVVAKYMPSASEDLKQYIAIGRLEVGRARDA
jgi:hypothetical protein